MNHDKIDLANLNAKSFLNFDINEFKMLIASAKQQSFWGGYLITEKYFNQHLFPFPTVHIAKGKRFVRVRIHQNDEKFYYNESELSYIKSIFKIRGFGRCNEPNQQAFYCSDSEILSYGEVSQIKRGLVPESHYFTSSLWELKEDINIAFLFHEHSPNSRFNWITNEWKKFFSCLNFKDKEVVLSFQRALADEFSIPSNRDQKNYIVSAAYANFILNVYGENNTKIQGFAYPTCLNVPDLKDKGVNFCFVPWIVGFGKKIELIAAHRTHKRRDTVLAERDTRM